VEKSIPHIEIVNTELCYTYIHIGYGGGIAAHRFQTGNTLFMANCQTQVICCVFVAICGVLHN
jgi:hypothetical protein